MNLKTINFTVRIELLILLFVLGTIMGSHLFSSCSRYSLQEGMKLIGSNLDYKMGSGLSDTWSAQEQKEGSSVKWRSQDHDTYDSDMVKPDDTMNFFANTNFAPECCGSSYSANGGINGKGFSSGGCACLNKNQLNYINERGGNRTLPDQF